MKRSLTSEKLELDESVANKSSDTRPNQTSAVSPMQDTFQKAMTGKIDEGDKQLVSQDTINSKGIISSQGQTTKDQFNKLK